MKKEIRNRRIVALIAILVIGFAYMVSGQTFEKVQNFRGRMPLNYDTTKYFCVGIKTMIDSKIIETDSLNVWVCERNADTKLMFVCSEKVKIFLKYNTLYDIYVTKNGYTVSKLVVPTKIPTIKCLIDVWINIKHGSRVVEEGLLAYDKSKNNWEVE